uniref:HSPB1 associated protein 1 n=1 Tax=Pipistrellus kuhlii TaxID=59472 RepID=A0A7J8A705_PIPKU|nr:HSPB1 associated protein 1 [Pipistrellus kuhlii]
MAAGSGATTATGTAVGTGEEKDEYVKPFTPEKAKEIIMSLQQPAVFCNMAFDWPARHWTAEHLSKVLHGKQIRFRMGMKSTDTVPQFETSCSYVDATLEEFLTWNRDHSSISGPFIDYDYSKFWAYADYKYVASLFEDKTGIFQDVIWYKEGKDGISFPLKTLLSFIQLESLMKNPVCSVKSMLSILMENVSLSSRKLEDMSPGQVLFVPRHWWHYVESIDPVTVSINSWIELEEDHQARVEEAITRMLVCALKTAEGPASTRAWLNPTEVEEPSHEVNCCYLNRAVSAFFDHYRTSKTADVQALRTNGEHMKKEEFNVHALMEVEQTGSQNLTMGTVGEQAPSPFGPDLVPVLPSSEAPPSETESMFKNDGNGFVGKDGEHFDKSHRSKKPRLVSGRENEIVEQTASNSTMGPSQTFISTDDLLDCLVNPQVIKIVAQLLIQGRSL